MVYTETLEKLKKVLTPLHYEVVNGFEVDDDGFYDIVIMTKYGHVCTTLRFNGNDELYNIITSEISPIVALEILKAVGYPINDD